MSDKPASPLNSGQGITLQDQAIRSAMAFVNMLAGDTKMIAYRPPLALLLGSPLAAILLQQITFRWCENQGKPFYKFNAPCSHPQYRAGDSWIEELAFTRYLLDSSMKVIATKITKGVSKKSVLAVTQPLITEGIMQNSHCLVLYYTDADRLTWYDINPHLLGNAIHQLYLGNVEIQHYLRNGVLQHYSVMGDSSITSRTESNGTESGAENTAEKKMTGTIGTEPELMQAGVILPGSSPYLPEWFSTLPPEVQEYLTSEAEKGYKIIKSGHGNLYDCLVFICREHWQPTSLKNRVVIQHRDTGHTVEQLLLAGARWWKAGKTPMRLQQTLDNWSRLIADYVAPEEGGMSTDEWYEEFRRRRDNPEAQ